MANYNDLIKAGLLNAGDRRDAGLMGLIALGQSIGNRGAARLSPTPPPLDLAGPMAVYQNSMNTSLQRGALAKKLNQETALRKAIMPQPVNEPMAQRIAQTRFEPTRQALTALYEYSPLSGEDNDMSLEADGIPAMAQDAVTAALPAARQMTTVPTALQGVPAAARPLISAVAQANPMAGVQMAGNLIAKSFAPPDYKVVQTGPASYGRLNSKTGEIQPLSAGQGGMSFGGTGMDAQSFNTIMNLGSKIANSTATDRERQAYTLAYGYLSRERTETRKDPATNAEVQVRIPAQDLRSFPQPASAGGQPSAAQPTTPPERIVGGGLPPKPADGEAKAASFSARMDLAAPILDSLEEARGQGIMLTQAQVMLGSVPGVGDYLKRSSMNVAQQKYLAAAMDWIRAKLRRDSGAAIGEREAIQEYETYFPVPGNPPEVMKQKRELRATVQEGMRGEALPAITYQEAVKRKQAGSGSKPTASAPAVPKLEDIQKKYGVN